MALKALLLKRQIDEKKSRMAALSAKTKELDTRETELAAALEEASTEEELRSVQELVDAFSQEQEEHRAAVSALEASIAASEEELRALEEKKPSPPAPAAVPVPSDSHERKEDVIMPSRMTRAFCSMTPEQRAAFIQREEVQDFLARFREMFKDGQKRSVSGAELEIPTVLLGLIRQNIENYSKMLRHVRLVSVPGQVRQNIMGEIPEAVWTEACGALNELDFYLSNVEVDGFKVGGYVAICNALLDDAGPALLAEIILGMGAAIGIAVDKSIFFGTGVKMPLGIATRLAQTSKPSDYPKTAREWENLSQSNVITIPAGTTGLPLFQRLVQAAAASKGSYSRGNKFWSMNEATYSSIQVEATNTNAAGAIISMLNGTMPVVGGDILVFSDRIIPDNTIIGGYGDLYLLAERAGASVEYSDIPLFIQDQTVVKATARYDGKPVIPEGFVVIGLGQAPTLEMPFAQDVANPSVAALRSLAVGALSLEPAFHPDTLEYTASTSNATNMISAVPTTGFLATIKVNGKKVRNGAATAWEAGENTVSITVTNGEKSKTYTVTVTKE